MKLRYLPLVLAILAHGAAEAATSHVVTTPNATGSLVTGNLSKADSSTDVTDSGIQATDVLQKSGNLSGVSNTTTARANIGVPDFGDISAASANYNASCGQSIFAWNLGTGGIINFPATPPQDCTITVRTIGKDALINLNGQTALINGFGMHNIGSFRLPAVNSLGNRNSFFTMVFNGTIWQVLGYSMPQWEALTPLTDPLYAHGQVHMSHDGVNSRVTLCPLRGMGGVIIHAQMFRIPAGCIWTPDSASTSSTTNDIYAFMTEAQDVTGAVNNGSGLIRITVTNVYATGAQVALIVHSVGGTIEADGPWLGTVIDSTHIDLIGSAFTNAFVAGGSPKARIVGLVLNTTGHTNTNGIETINTGDDDYTFVGTAVYGASHAFTSLISWFNSPYDVSGAAKSNGDGTFSVAGCANLSDGACYPPAYTNAGAALTGLHLVKGTAAMIAGAVTITLSGSAVFTNSTSYQCVLTDRTAANPAQFSPTSGTSFTINGTSTDTIAYLCWGN